MKNITVTISQEDYSKLLVKKKETGLSVSAIIRSLVSENKDVFISLHCPKCKCEDVSYLDLSFERESRVDGYICSKCKNEFSAVYKLSGLVNR